EDGGGEAGGVGGVANAATPCPQGSDKGLCRVAQIVERGAVPGHGLRASQGARVKMGDARHLSSPQLAWRWGGAPKPSLLRLKLGQCAPFYKREVLSDGLAKLIWKAPWDERPSAALERAARLRGRRAAQKLQQGGRRAERDPGRNQPSDSRARRGSGGATVPAAESCRRIDRLCASAVAGLVRSLCRYPGLGAAAAGA